MFANKNKEIKLQIAKCIPIMYRDMGACFVDRIISSDYIIIFFGSSSVVFMSAFFIEKKKIIKK